MGMPAETMVCEECGTEFLAYAVFEGVGVIRPLVCFYCFELERWFT